MKYNHKLESNNIYRDNIKNLGIDSNIDQLFLDNLLFHQ